MYIFNLIVTPKHIILHIVKSTSTVTLQVHVSEVEGHPLTNWQPYQIDTLAVMGIVVWPVGGNDDALTVGEGTTTSGVT